MAAACRYYRAVQTWPGFSPAGSLVIPLSASCFRDVRDPVTVAAIHLAPKSEFHVTVLNSVCANEVRRELRQRAIPESRLATHFEACDWTVRDTRERWLLRRAEPGEPVAHSIITLLDLPALNAFRRRLGNLCGLPLPDVPAHVTLYTAGDPRGIGLASEAQFAERRVRRME